MIKVGNLGLSKIFFGATEVTGVFNGNDKIFETNVISYPILSGSYTYNGSVQTATFTNYNPNTSTATGLSGTNAGTYTAIFTPREGYCWPDKSTTPYSVEWSIAKASGTLSISPSSITFRKYELSATITVSSNCLGTVRVLEEPRGTSVSISGNTITMTADGSTNIDDWEAYVMVIPDSNHNAPSTVTLRINADYRLPVGGRIFYIDSDNGATYKFWDSNDNVLSTQTVAGLANATKYQVISGVPSSDKFYVYNPTLENWRAWGKSGTLIDITTDGIGKGKTNTNTALAQSGWETGTIFSYIQYCRAMSVGSCDDWYIGSVAEQDQLRQSGLVNWYSVATIQIWTSVEETAQSAYTWINNRTAVFDKSSNMCRCFAMRSF